MKRDLPDLHAARERMVRHHLADRGITDPDILRAFREVPRELFVAPEDVAAAYDDNPLPIAAKQTISQPYIVALMIQLARVRSGDHVLEVGAGSGYAAALLGRIAASVVAVERHARLARLAAERMERLGYSNVRILHGDGERGVAEAAPFDAIILSAAAAAVPAGLPEQLRPGGVLVMPVGAPDEVQQLVRTTRCRDGSFLREELGAVRFVPLVSGLGHGAEGERGRGGG